MTEQQPPARQSGALYTEPQMATLLHCGTRTLRGLRQSGRLQFLRIGRAIVYPDEYLQAYIDRHGAPVDPVADRGIRLQRR